ncbi:type III export protein PscK [Pseudomonas brenneri]|uniref:Type III export protein PscK n=1 Tax=Pseudomonas brenneri TaxID=129817 RepID=A0A5B2V5H2_9PSED|nr:Yop proteins translocation protein K [Pseudomonas brenneri]KAA2233795.1 type III export protein PscK [Pseudomonas brenneri]TWR81971.1 type III export protein PscK [Pseudomonas brenneri]GGL23693.1 type III export protein PscK [Pseudomonas brenneri]SDU94359.1 type III secretion protein K [Pseudomonas brenneri]
MTLLLTPYQLRFCPARYIHPTRLPSSLAGLTETLDHWRRHRGINAWLLNEFALGIEYELPPMLGGLAFFEQAALEKTLGYLGALLHGHAIRQVLDAQNLRRVHAAIGEAGHRYCLEQLELIIGSWPQGWQQPLPAGELVDCLRQRALEFWLLACDDAPSGFSRRLALRLAPGESRLLVSPQRWHVSSSQRPLAQALCLKIARQVSPQCFHLLK